MSCYTQNNSILCLAVPLANLPGEVRRKQHRREMYNLFATWLCSASEPRKVSSCHTSQTSSHILNSVSQNQLPVWLSRWLSLWYGFLLEKYFLTRNDRGMLRSSLFRRISKNTEIFPRRSALRLNALRFGQLQIPGGRTKTSRRDEQRFGRC